MELNKKQFLDICNNYFDKNSYNNNISVPVNHYNVMDNFYDTDENIWDIIQENLDVIEVDYEGELLNNHDFDYDAEMEVEDIEFFELEDIIDEHSKIDKYIKKWEDDKVDSLTPNMFIQTWKILDTQYFIDRIKEYDVYELEDLGILKRYFNTNIDEVNPIDNLAYWTIYFIPTMVMEDWELAHKVGLTPFKYQDRFMLALGGCGMDLSPKLDAFQALSNGTIPNGSKLITDKKYFEYVVGKKITKEVEEKCKINPNIKVTLKLLENDKGAV